MLWIQVYELFGQFHAEIRCNSFANMRCDHALASCFDRRDGRKRQLIIHERIVRRNRPVLILLAIALALFWRCVHGRRVAVTDAG